MRSDEEILAELEKLGEQDSNDHEIDTLREIVHELLDDRTLLARQQQNYAEPCHICGRPKNAKGEIYCSYPHPTFEAQPGAEAGREDGQA